MKLRLRSIQSKETLKIQLSDSSTLHQLKQILSQLLPHSPPPASIRLSLNRKDELRSDGEEFLHSLGIASGDLIFFSLEQHAIGTSSNSQNTLSLGSESSLNPESKDSESSVCLNSSENLPEVKKLDFVSLGSCQGETLGEDIPMEENRDCMEVEDESNEIKHNCDETSLMAVENSYSVPGFLRRVFTEELDNCGSGNHKMIVIAIHAVMLESGFVGFDRNANKAITGFRFHDSWPSNLLGMSPSYTLPEILDSGNGIKSVALKFQSLQKFITVYGTLTNGLGKGGMHRVHLNVDQLIPFLNVVWANCGEAEIINAADGAFTSPDKEVFKFWTTVKDNLALPLLIDLCEEAGLELPPCFMRLPTDLKLKILESLPGVDLARVSCVCSELQYLGSNDDLWKLKYSEEFGNGTNEPYGSWKKAYVTLLWSRRINRNVQPSPFWPSPYCAHSRRRYPNPFMVPRVPRIIGGDYDIFPQPNGHEIHTRFHDPANHRGMNILPHCNLGFHSGRFV